MTKTANKQATRELIEFLHNKNEEAKKAGIEQHARFTMATAHTLGSLIAFDLEPAGYGPMLESVLESIIEGIQSAAKFKGVKVDTTFIKVVRD
ncbi:hypothetical protein [Paenibacillus brevis]|uniref:Uncharacterized protein n=1 Tax=Paenibacillus brevis TaxID=2841508 RepID=A0ABS6FSX9_9BACL|nr:hypothetical protein [Paenibacillus brevis]MBU5673214.1 hypothetical protein [Paenibacillus brevis]